MLGKKALLRVTKGLNKLIKAGDDLRDKHLLMLNDFHDIEQHIKDVQTQLNSDIKTSTNKLIDLVGALDLKQNKTEALCLKDSTRIGHHDITIDKLCEDYDNLYQKSLQKWAEYSEKEELYQQKEEFEDFKEKIQKELQHSKKEHEEIVNRIMTIENYTDKYIPINTQNTI